MKGIYILLLVAIAVTFATANPRTFETNQVEEDVVETPPQVEYGATRMKNKIKGPADMGIYYINSPGGKFQIITN